jgi:hypothetical protein
MHAGHNGTASPHSTREWPDNRSTRVGMGSDRVRIKPDQAGTKCDSSSDR